MEPRINEPIRQGKSKPVKYWRCVGSHYLNSCHDEKNKDVRVYNLKEVSIVGDVPRKITRIYVALENFQADHQSSMIEIEGKIKKITSFKFNRFRSYILLC